MNSTLHRETHNKIIAGVCSAVSARTGLDVNVIRLVTAAATLFGSVVGIGLAVPLLYVTAWLLLPEKGSDTSIAQRWFGGPSGPLNKAP